MFIGLFLKKCSGDLRRVLWEWVTYTYIAHLLETEPASFCAFLHVIFTSNAIAPNSNSSLHIAFHQHFSSDVI